MNLRRAFWISAALMLAGIAAILLWSAPRIEAGGLEPFDTRTGGYTHADAVAFLAALTDTGRAAYLGPQRLADTVFPIGLLGVLAFGILIAFRRWSMPLAAVAALVPLGFFAFDMLENAAVAGLLRSGAEAITPGEVARADFYTRWKFHFVNASLGLLALGWAARGIGWMRRRRAG